MAERFNSSKNFGWGGSMSFSAKGAISDRYGGGHFGTIAAHNQRIESCIEWARENGYNRWDKFDQTAAERFSQHIASRVQCGSMSSSYGQNLVSTMNVTMSALRGDGAVYVSPASVGQRSHVRTEAPGGVSRDSVSAAQAAMRATGYDRAAAVAGLAREFGMRVREASLANLDRLSREARTLGRINIQDGTKGGRDAPRWVEITKESQIDALKDAIAARSAGSQNLVEKSESLKDFISREVNAAREELKAAGIEKFHDLRSAYACERYQELTGHAAPVLREPGEARPDRDLDREARMQVSEELGHGREDVVSAYIGGKR